MGAIFGNLGLVFVIVAIAGGSLAALVIGYILLSAIVGGAAAYDAKKTTAKSLNDEHDRDMGRQGRAGKQFSVSERKFVPRPSIVDQRTTHQEHH